MFRGSSSTDFFDRTIFGMPVFFFLSHCLVLVAVHLEAAWLVHLQLWGSFALLVNGMCHG